MKSANKLKKIFKTIFRVDISFYNILAIIIFLVSFILIEYMIINNHEKKYEIDGEWLISYKINQKEHDKNQ